MMIPCLRCRVHRRRWSLGFEKKTTAGRASTIKTYRACKHTDACCSEHPKRLQHRVCQVFYPYSLYGLVLKATSPKGRIALFASNSQGPLLELDGTSGFSLDRGIP